jgi:hypothetical protein
MTQDQAARRAEQIVSETAAALSPKPRLESAPIFGNGPSACLADIPDAGKMVSVAYTFWLRGVPENENGKIGLQIKAHWQKQGYHIEKSSGFDKGQPDISGVTKDNFLISLNWSSNGALSVGATSPCVYPHGTPSP